ncbi:tomoregulin-2 isoform X2 [Poecilia reticulata]|uniref:tomoregulin-2 isoform X2 n=1 Tax=Poecilia reticulata TaxID=8081 RepID=UPI0007E9D801|nr:PREDICTED: tomoregulin-2 isoform X2 [Poecilia reticulata]
MSEGDCPAGGEGSAETGQKETSTCDICQFGAECDVDAEDVWCVCNIDCSHISFNPVCASDGRSYDNPCQVKEESCQKQERIEVKYLGRCQGDITTGSKGGGHFPHTTEDSGTGQARGLYIPCPDHYKNYCAHGDCQFPNMVSQPSCSCHSGYMGPKCDIKEYNVLYVVPGSGKLHYVLIASIIGALQVVIICVVVLCITRKCPRTNRINRQKQNNVHFSSENTMRASTRLI